MLSSRRKPAAAGDVKVVVIETRHVRTDAEHFKTVVQSLTGKDSTLEAVVPEKPSIVGRSVHPAAELSVGGSAEERPHRAVQPAVVLPELERLHAMNPVPRLQEHGDLPDGSSPFGYLY